MKSVIGQAMEASPNAVFICVTNPLDVMTTLAFRESGLPANRLMGMGGVLDSSRLAFAVCEQLGCAPADVTAWAVGAHGEGMVCWPRFTTVDGTPITELMDEAAVASVVQRCVKGGAEVVAFLKTGSAYYAPGASIAKMVEAILTDSHEVMSVCAHIDGQYGIEDLYMNVPVRLGKNGVEEVVEFDLNDDELAALRRALYFDLGVPFPGINLRVSPALPGLSYVLQVNEIPMSRGQLEAGMVLARESEDTLRMLGVEVKKGEAFLPDVESLWIPQEKQAVLEQAGLSCMSPSRILAYHLSLMLARHASGFIGMQETKYLLDRMEERAPDLVREATRLLPVQRIAEIFQRLAQEQVSIRDLRSILEAVIEWSPKEKDTVMLTEYVRGALKRQISYMYSRGQNMLPAILMDPSVEETIRKSIRQTSAGAFLALDPDTTRRFVEAVTAAAGDYRKHPQMPVLLASMDIRRYVRRLIEGEHYRLPVVSYQEITPEISVQPVNRIRL